jgi:hypothetical protein
MLGAVKLERTNPLVRRAATQSLPHSAEVSLSPEHSSKPAPDDATIVESRGDLLAMAPTPPYQKPVMGRLPKRQNAYIGSRFGGDGVCTSLATGELMAELIDTGKTPLRARRMFERLAPR